MNHHKQIPMIGRHLLSRRSAMGNMAFGLSSIALTKLLSDNSLLAREDENTTTIRPQIDPQHPHAARDPHFPAAAKNVIMIFCAGACSHLDTFDYKSELIKRDGEPLPGAADLVTFQGKQGNITRSPWEFRPRGETGKMISTLVDHIGEHADDMAFIHSLTSKTNTHGPGENFMSTGFTLDGFPSIGSWATYALGSETAELPAFVAIPDPRGTPQSSVNNWGPGFLPATFQGTAFNTINPIRNLLPPSSLSQGEDVATREFLKRLNDRHLARFPGDTQLAARIASYELAARMQLSVPQISDLSTETAATLKMYAADDTSNTLRASFAKNCILARRLVEKGVRFIQLFNGSYQTGGEGTSNWDGHKMLKDQYSLHGPVLDQPVAALLTDLKQRGLLKDTLVVWTTEFGRMPTFQSGASGRDHNPSGFTAWMMGAGVKAPFSYGATDEFGHRAVENVSTVYDFHATILHSLGLDHKRLTFYHNGIERRLTDVHGHVIHDVLRPQITIH
jgi:hypothetical protein